MLTELFIEYFGRVAAIRRHEVLASCNYDFPKEILEWVVSQAEMDIATAQMIYWRMKPESVRDYEVEEDIPIMEAIEQRNDCHYDAVKNNTDNTPESFYHPEVLKNREGKVIEGISDDDSIQKELFKAYKRLVCAMNMEDCYQ